MWWVLLSILFRSASAVTAKQAGLTSEGTGLHEVRWNPWYLLSLAAQAGCWRCGDCRSASPIPS